MNTENSSTFEEVFKDERVNMIVAAITTAVSNACDLHDPVVGSNATTFGTNVYHFGVSELKKLAALQPKVFQFRQSGNLFRLFVEDFELAFHRVGYDVSEGIENSFPNNEDAVSRIVFQNEQDQLAFMGEGFEVPTSKKYVLAHFADPVGGLSGVYLCKPSKKANAIAWDVTHELWKSTTANDQFEINVRPQTAPVEKVGEIKLQPKEKLGEIILFPREEKGTINLDE